MVTGERMTVIHQGEGAAAIEERRPMTVEEFQGRQKLIKAVVGEMKDGVHYGLIPGTKGGRTLWEAGAEYMRAAFNVAWDYEFTEEHVDHETGDYRFTVRAYHLVGAGQRIGGWTASAWSKERKFWCSGNCPKPCEQLHAPMGMDKGDLYNNVRDRAIKRAFVNLIRNVTGTSGEFSGAAVNAKDTDDNAAGGGANASMGICPVHGLAFVQRSFRPKGSTQERQFWACPSPKDAKAGYCQMKPDDWLKAQVKQLGFDSAKAVADYLGEDWKVLTAKHNYAEIVGLISEKKATEEQAANLGPDEGTGEAAPASAAARPDPRIVRTLDDLKALAKALNVEWTKALQMIGVADEKVIRDYPGAAGQLLAFTG